MPSTSGILRWLLVGTLCAAMSASVLRGQEPPPLRILPLGDSITYGVSAPVIYSGYRDLLYALLDDVDYNIDFVGTVVDTHNLSIPDPHHEGHRGFRIDQISSGLGGWLDRIDDPDVVLLMIGTNDFLQSFQTAQASTRLESLIGQITTARPFAKVVVANIVPNTNSPSIEAAQIAFNSTIPSIVSNQVSLGRDVHFVDLHAVVTPADISTDGIHPNETGYDKMANEWFDAITPIIGPYGDNEPPAIARVRPVTPHRVDVTFSKPVEDAAANPSMFNLDAGASVVGAVLDESTKRTVTLTTTTLAPDIDHTLSVTGVSDRTPEHHTIAPGTTANFLTPYLWNGGFEFDFTAWNASGNLQIVADLEKYLREGRRVVAFNSANTSPNGVLTQTFVTTPGHAYRLLLSVGVLAFNSNQQRLRCIVSGTTQLLSQTISLNGQGGGKIVWTAREFMFVADSASTTITLSDVSTTTNSIDLLLDDVRVESLLNRTLTVQSSPAGASVSLSPADNSGLTNGSTPLARHYFNGAAVTVTAPGTFGGGVFQKWQLNGEDYDTHPSTVLTMNGDHTLLAVYVANAPVIESDPQDLTATMGATATFSVSASGTPPLAYQWRRDGQDIPGATQSSYSIANVEASDAALYDVVVSNLAGSLTSNAALLTVISSGNLANGSFESDLDGWTATGHLITYDGTPPGAHDGDKFVIYNGSNSTPNGVLTQRITTTPGQTYTLAFSMGVYSWNTDAQDLELVILGDSVLASQTFTLSGLGGGSTHWVTRSVDFVANSPTTTVRFADVSTTTSSIDLLLDGVTLTSALAPTRTLTVDSTPLSDVVIIVSPSDENGDDNGSTPFSRIYADGTVVTLTAPQSVDGNTFEKWQVDGLDYSTDPEITVALNNDRTAFAVYTPPVWGSLQNGSFESDFSFWTTSGNMVIATGANYVGTDGTKIVAFNGGNSAPDGVLTQSFATIPGQSYLLEFDYGVRAFNSQTVRLRVIVTGNTTLLSQLNSVAGINGGNVRWIARSFMFTADSEVTTLTFEDASTVTSNIDLLLDHVRLAALPTPTRTLTVGSTPASGVDISVSPSDDNGAHDGHTPFNRTYVDGTLITLTAPVSAHGNPFEKWQLNGADYSTDPEITFSISGDLAAVAVYTPPVSASLQNGSFESDFDAWTASGNLAIATGVNYIGTNGAKIVVFNGGNSTPNGVLVQSFATIPGTAYTLAFDYGVRAFNTQTVRLRAIATGNATLLSQLNSVAGISGGKLRWLPQSITFVADSEVTTLTFQDESTVTENIDLLLDHVRITPL